MLSCLRDVADPVTGPDSSSFVGKKFPCKPQPQREFHYAVIPLVLGCGNPTQSLAWGHLFRWYPPCHHRRKAPYTSACFLPGAAQSHRISLGYCPMSLLFWSPEMLMFLNKALTFNFLIFVFYLLLLSVWSRGNLKAWSTIINIIKNYSTIVPTSPMITTLWLHQIHDNTRPRGFSLASTRAQVVWCGHSASSPHRGRNRGPVTCFGSHSLLVAEPGR